SLLFILGADRSLEGLFLFSGPAFSPCFEIVAPDRRQDARCLFAAHHGNACVWPHPEKARSIGAPTHPIVPRAEAAADDHGEFRNGGGCHRRYHLGPVAGDAAGFILPPYPEARNILKEDQGNAPLRAELDEVGGL